MNSNIVKTKQFDHLYLVYHFAVPLIYEIKTEHIYEYFSSNKEMFNFSNYTVKSKY